jgi:hypothetical protein
MNWVHLRIAPEPFKSKLLQKHLGYIIKYSKHGTLDESTTMAYIVQVIQKAMHSAANQGDANPSSTTYLLLTRRLCWHWMFSMPWWWWGLFLLPWIDLVRLVWHSIWWIWSLLRRIRRWWMLVSSFPHVAASIHGGNAWSLATVL